MDVLVIPTWVITSHITSFYGTKSSARCRQVKGTKRSSSSFTRTCGSLHCLRHSCTANCACFLLPTSPSSTPSSEQHALVHAELTQQWEMRSQIPQSSARSSALPFNSSPADIGHSFWLTNEKNRLWKLLLSLHGIVFYVGKCPWEEQHWGCSSDWTHCSAA